MSVPTEVRTYITGTIGESPVSIGSFPVSPDITVVLIPTGGLAPQLKMGAVGVEVDSTTLQVICRGIKDDFATPYNQANTIHDGLAQVQTQTLTSFFHFIKPMQPPFSLGKDAEGRYMIAFNVMCTREP